MPRVNPEILVWAREGAGLDIEAAAKKLGLKPDRLQEIEGGAREPSRPQLANMADAYRRPLVAFYLAKPPTSEKPLADFRNHAFAALTQESEAVLAALVRDVRVRQNLVKNALEDAEDAEPVTFIGSAAMREGEATVARKIAETLKFTRADFRTAKDARAAFAALRHAAERAGVYVLLIGNLGSHHTNLDARAFRGFSIADPVAPFIVINETDSPAAWSFTLLHEMTHILLGEVGISGYDSEVKIEKFCDAVAGAFLLDATELTAFPDKASHDQAMAWIGDFAKARNVSRHMVAYNLRRIGRLRSDVYGQLVKTLFAPGGAPKAKTETESGPNFYVVRRHRLGASLVSLVSRYVAGGVLTSTKAGTILGVKPTSVGPLIDAGRVAA